MARGFRELGYEVDFSSPLMVQVGSNRHTLKNKILRTISLKAPTIVYEFLMLLFNIISYTRTKKMLKKNKYDFIYERYAFFDFSLLFLKRNFKVHIVLEVNGAVNRKDPTHGRKIVLKKFACYLERKVFNTCDLIVVVSTSLKNSLREIGVEPGKILVLPNAVDTERFDRSVSGEEIRRKYDLENKKIIGFVGSFTFWHGLHFLIQNMSDVLDSNEDTHLLLVGSGREKEKIKEMIKRFGIENSVTMTGQVPHEKVPYYIAAMDIGVMPDSNDFGSPMKIFEYMVMGKPVVSAKYRPTSEVILNGKNGFLFEPKNGHEFVALIIRLLENHDLRNSIGINGANYVSEHHTWESNAHKVLEACRAIS